MNLLSTIDVFKTFLQTYGEKEGISILNTLNNLKNSELDTIAFFHERMAQTAGCTNAELHNSEFSKYKHALFYLLHCKLKISCGMIGRHYLMTAKGVNYACNNFNNILEAATENHHIFENNKPLILAYQKLFALAEPMQIKN